MFDDADEMRAALERLVLSSTLLETREAVAAEPRLLDTPAWNCMTEAVRRTRQIGDTRLADAVQFRLELLRYFRDHGIRDGYLELAVEQLVSAPTAEETEAVLSSNPELRDGRTADYLKRRIDECHRLADDARVARYEMALLLSSAGSISSSDSAEISEAVNTFFNGFVRETDPAELRRLLDAHPELLDAPETFVVESMFQPPMSRAWTEIELVELRDLAFRRELFRRCRAVGIAKAFAELEEGVLWDGLARR